MPEEDEDDDEARDVVASNGVSLSSNQTSSMMWAPALPPARQQNNLGRFHSVTDLRVTDDEVKRRK